MEFYIIIKWRIIIIVYLAIIRESSPQQVIFLENIVLII